MAEAEAKVAEETGGARGLIEYRVDKGVALVVLNDPPANTYSYEMMQ